MAHARQTIREAAAGLLAATPTNWNKVYETRIASSRQVWPYLMVFDTEETSSQATVNSSGIYQRSMTLSIVGMLKLPGTGDGTGMTETIEDRMDTVAAEIETKLTLSALAAVCKVQFVELQSTSKDVITTENNDISHAEITTTWSIGYYTSEGYPSTLL